MKLEGFETSYALTRADALSTELDPGVFIINFQLQDGSSLGLLRAIKRRQPEAVVLMVSSSPNDAGGILAMKFGAYDVITNPLDRKQLVESIKEALGTRESVPMQVAPPIPDRPDFKSLTPRERQVLQLIVSGKSNKVASRDLAISPRTVEVHRAHVMEKLHARNTADLVRIVYGK